MVDQQLANHVNIDDRAPGGDLTYRLHELADRVDPVFEQVTDTARASFQQFPGRCRLDELRQDEDAEPGMLATQLNRG